MSGGFNVPVLGHVTYGGIIAGVIIGYILAPQVRKIPVLNRAPQA